MIAPSSVPQGQFQSLSCEVNYCFASPKKIAVVKRRSLADDLEAAPTHTQSLRRNPKRSARAKFAHETVDTPSEPLLSSNTPEQEQMDIESLVGDAISDMGHLLDFAFRKLLGVRGASPGMRTLRNSMYPSLIDIAPAVWDLKYLRVSLSDDSLVFITDGR